MRSVGAKSGRRHGAAAAACGALLLLLRPAYVAAELAVAAATRGGYSLWSDSVSRLGEVGCSASYCSPRHAWMNGSFVLFGVMLAAGAALLRHRLGRLAAALLIISGLSSIATGLAPLDRDAALHTLAAAPLFAAQPAALVVLGLRLRASRPVLSRVLVATGCVTAAAAVGFVTAGDGAGAGALERLALWPVIVALAAYAWTELRRPPGT